MVAGAKAISVGIAALSSVITGLTAAFAAVGITTLGPALVVIAAIVQVLVGLYIIVDDIIAYMRGGNSIIGLFFKAFEEPLRPLMAAFKDLGAELASIGNMLMREVFTPLGGWLSADFIDILMSFKPVVSGLISVFSFFFTFLIRSFIISIKLARQIIGFFAELFNGDIVTNNSLMKNLEGILNQVYEIISAWDTLSAILSRNDEASKALDKKAFGFSTQDMKDRSIGAVKGLVPKKGQTLRLKKNIVTADDLDLLKQASPTAGIDAKLRAASARMMSDGENERLKQFGVLAKSNTTNNITINAPNADPKALASEAVKAQDSLEARKLRQARAQTKARGTEL
jgi:hypothetical protein